jgi:hypothetical protein
MKIRIGDKVVDVDMKDGVPTIKAETEEIHHPDGRVDVVVKVPCLQISGGTNGESDL